MHAYVTISPLPTCTKGSSSSVPLIHKFKILNSTIFLLSSRFHVIILIEAKPKCAACTDLSHAKFLILCIFTTKVGGRQWALPFALVIYGLLLWASNYIKCCEQHNESAFFSPYEQSLFQFACCGSQQENHRKFSVYLWQFSECAGSLLSPTPLTEPGCTFSLSNNTTA